jgi:hypothetical protein
MTTSNKTINYTPKGEVAEAIHSFCADERFPQLLKLNPQDLIRAALYDQGIIPKQQTGQGDRSYWSPGDAIKTSLWGENHMALTQYAKEHSTSNQAVIAAAVQDYLNTRNN